MLFASEPPAVPGESSESDELSGPSAAEEEPDSSSSSDSDSAPKPEDEKETDGMIAIVRKHARLYYRSTSSPTIEINWDVSFSDVVLNRFYFIYYFSLKSLGSI